MKLVRWEQLAAQGVPRWQVHKRVAGGSQRRGAKRPVDVCPAPTEAERRRRSVPCLIWSRPWLRKITALLQGAFGERNAPTSGWCIIAPLVN